MSDLYVSLILTQRCNAKCQMCNCHLYPSKPEEEFTIELVKKLPRMKNVTLTGGEPFLRNDIHEIVSIVEKKADRILINTNGYFTERIVDLCKKHPKVGIRISLDGFEKTHNSIRGVPDIYKHVIDTLTQVEKIRGKRDLGVGFCVQECNYKELIPTYRWANKHGYEFGFSVVQNSVYFHKEDNMINSEDEIVNQLEILKKMYLKSWNIKDWGRAYFTDGAQKYVTNQKKRLMCDAGRSSFFITPQGNVLPCNDFPQEMIMGNLNKSSWEEIMDSEAAKSVVKACEYCNLNCWSICNMGSQIRKNKLKIGIWSIRNKMKFFPF